MSMLKNQIIGMYRQSASVEEISEALEVDVMVVKAALTGLGAVGRKIAKEEEDDVSEEEAREMAGIIKGIARDENAGVYAQLNAAKYVHGIKRGYHRVHSDATLGSEELFLRLNEAYQGASRRARLALVVGSGQGAEGAPEAASAASLFNERALEFEAIELPVVKPLENHIDTKLLEKLEVVQEALREQPAALNPGPLIESKGHYLVFDTETSGFPRMDGTPLNEQPYLLQLGALLLDERFNVIDELNALVNYGYDVPINPKALEVHGISNEKCRQFGLSPIEIFLRFESLRLRACVLVAHNKEFDDKIWKFFVSRLGKSTHQLASYCTMVNMMPIVKLPFKDGRAGYKRPSLAESYKHATGKELEVSHDAMADVRTTVEVLRWLKNR